MARCYCSTFLLDKKYKYDHNLYFNAQGAPGPMKYNDIISSKESRP